VGEVCQGHERDWRLDGTGYVIFSPSNLNLIKPRISELLGIINNKVTSSKVKTQYDQDNRSRTRQLNSNQVNTDMTHTAVDRVCYSLIIENISI
jgi:hypothetical protein